MSFAQVIPFMFPKTMSESLHKTSKTIFVFETSHDDADKRLADAHKSSCFANHSLGRKDKNKGIKIIKKENISCMNVVKARATSFWHIAHISLSVCCPNYRNGWRSSLRFGERHDKEFIHREKFHFTNDHFSSSSSTGWKISAKTAMNLEYSIWILYGDKEA